MNLQSKNFPSRSKKEQLIDSDLQELEKALLDDSKLPLSGGTLTGDVALSAGVKVKSLDSSSALTMGVSTVSIDTAGTFKGVAYTTKFASLNFAIGLNSTEVLTGITGTVYATGGAAGLNAIDAVNNKESIFSVTPDDITMIAADGATSSNIKAMGNGNVIIDSSTRKYSIKLDTYANNIAALAGGLVSSQLYQTATGEIRIVV